MSDSFLVNITNWLEYNGRADVKHASWFRFSNSLLDHHDLHQANAEVIMTWIYILCQASKKGAPCITFVPGHAAAHCRIKLKQIHDSIKYLSSIGWISFNESAETVAAIESELKKAKARNLVKKAVRNGVLLKPKDCSICGKSSYRIEAHHSDYDDPLNIEWLCQFCHSQKHAASSVRTSTLQTDRQTKIHTDTPTFQDRRPSFDFESIYAKYPRKEGKAAGLKICKKDLNDMQDFEDLEKAVAKYAAHCIKNKVEPQFIKHFSTFMGSWRDWLANDAGTATTEISRAHPARNSFNSVFDQPDPREAGRVLNLVNDLRNAKNKSQ